MTRSRKAAFAKAAAAPAAEKPEGQTEFSSSPETGTDGGAAAGTGQPDPAATTAAEVAAEIGAKIDPDAALDADLTLKVDDEPLPVGVSVVGPAKGRWRIGRKFTPVPTEFNSADLTPEQIKALMDDPELTVVCHL